MSNSFVTPWTVACLAPLSMGFPRQKFWSGLPFPSLGDLPNPGIEPASPALWPDSSPLSHWGSPFIGICVYVYMYILFFNQKKTALQCCVGFCHTKNVIQPQLYIYHLLPKPPPLPLPSSSRSLERARPGSLSLAEGATPTSYFTNDCVYIPEKALAPHSGTLVWKIPWMEEPGRLQSMGSLRVGHDWATSLSLFTFMHWRRKWQPSPVFLPGESQGWGSLVGCCLWGHTESDMTEVT